MIALDPEPADYRDSSNMNDVILPLPDELVRELKMIIERGVVPETKQDGSFELKFEKALVERVHGLKFEIYAKEHPPPHFHAKTAECSASFALDDGRLLKQSGDTRKLKKQVGYYFSKNRMKLIEFWNVTRPNDCPVGPIAAT